MRNTPVIAIVDDDVSVRAAMSDMVKSFGYGVVAFASGAEYLRSDLLYDVSCLITDVRMPGMNGLELQSRLITLGLSQPIVFLTAFPDKKVQDKAMKAGAIACFSKPCDRDDLLAKIRTVLAFRAAGEESL